MIQSLSMYQLGMKSAHSIIITAESRACNWKTQIDEKISRGVTVTGLRDLFATMIPAFTISSGQMPAKRRRADCPVSLQKDT